MRDAQIIRYNTRLQRESKSHSKANSERSFWMRTNPNGTGHCAPLRAFNPRAGSTRFPIYGNNKRFLLLTELSLPLSPPRFFLVQPGCKPRALFRLSDARERPKVPFCVYTKHVRVNTALKFHFKTRRCDSAIRISDVCISESEISPA